MGIRHILLLSSDGITVGTQIGNLFYLGLAESLPVRDTLAALGEVTGLAVRLAPLASAAPNPPSIANGVAPLCRLILQSHEGQCACRKFLAGVSGRCERNLTPGVHRCFTGLIELAVPITVQGQPVAVLLCGEFFGHKPAVRDFAQCLRRLQRLGIRLDRSRLRSAIFKSPVVQPARIRAAGRLLAEIAGYLGGLAAHCPFDRRAEDPACVTFAKALVARRPEEMPSTRNAACGAQVTEPYFCRRFKAATGMSFSQYVARLHVDRARELLRDLRLPITEVAYAAGFQSIPHFNHTFKRYTGLSPNGYRAKLREISPSAVTDHRPSARSTRRQPPSRQVKTRQETG